MATNCRSLNKEVEEPQYNFHVESNVLWVDTIYWTIRTDLLKMEVGNRIYTKPMTFSYLPDRFYLDFEKLSPWEFNVELVRVFDAQPPKSGYCFQVSFTLVASFCPRKVTYMNFDNSNASVYFSLDEFQSSRYNRNDVWMIKCVIWMYEQEPLGNDQMKEQTTILKKKISETSPDNRQCKKMAQLVGREDFGRLFTGLQDFRFADYKSTLLLRSMRYSDKLHEKISRHQNEMESEESIEDLGRLLGYIRTGQEHCIDKKGCILLYGSAFFCGLSYLKLQCSDFIKMTFKGVDFFDVDFFIDVMTISDIVNDKNLMDCASSWYLRNKQNVENSIQWNNFKNNNYELVKGFEFEILNYKYKLREVVIEQFGSFKPEKET